MVTGAGKASAQTKRSRRVCACPCTNEGFASTFLMRTLIAPRIAAHAGGGVRYCVWARAVTRNWLGVCPTSRRKKRVK